MTNKLDITLNIEEVFGRTLTKEQEASFKKWANKKAIAK